MSYSDFPNSCGTLNVPGINNFQFVPIQSIATFPDYINSSNTMVSAIVLLVGTNWYQGRSIEGSLEFKTGSTELGNPSTFVLSGLAKKIGPEIEALFATMVKGLFIVKFTDKNGQTKILGTPSAPVTFSYNYSQSKGVIEFDFKGTQLAPPPFYSV